MERLMLLDGNGLIYRGYFALPPLTTSKGELVNAVFGFCSIVLRGIQDITPGLRRGRLRPPGPDLPARAVRRVQGDPPADAGRPPRPVPEGPRGGQGAAHPRLRAGRLRGGRRDRHDHRRRRAARPRHDDRDRRPRHAPARHRPHPADDDAVRGREHDPLRPREDRRAVRPRARPDDRLQGAQGRPDRQHPGRARGRREDRGQAHPRVRDARGAVRADRRGQARQAAREAHRASRVGVHGQGPLDDRPRPAGRVRPRGGPARRLRPRDGHPALPRVRVPLADRAPAGDDRRDRGRRRRGAARRRDRRLRARGARRRCRPAVRLGDGATGRARRRRAAGCSCRSTSMPCRAARAAVPAPATETDAAAGDRAPAAARPPVVVEPGDLPTALAAAIADPSRIEVHAGRRYRGARAVARRPARGRDRACCSTTRDRGAARRWPSRSPGRDGRTVAVEGAEDAATLRRLLDRLAVPVVGHEVKPLLVARIARRPGRRRDARSRSTPRSPPTSSTPRCAARRSPTSSPSSST